MQRDIAGSILVSLLKPNAIFAASAVVKKVSTDNSGRYFTGRQPALLFFYPRDSDTMHEENGH